MATTDQTGSSPVATITPDAPAAEHKKLKGGVLGMSGVVFTVLATAAPITAMTGNVPIAIGYGSGTGTPAGFIFATAVLVIFTIGYSAMARHITATGAFYGFITRGLGRVAGLASGLMATLAYVVFEASLIGIFASFFKTDVENFGGPHLSWIVYGLVGIALIAGLGYFDISLSGKVLAIFLVAEVLILLLMGGGVLFHGGGPDGLVAGALNPGKAFTAVAGGSSAIGLFFAFWSWVGFETTAVYGEESRNPTKIIPRATLIVVVALGLLYTFISWMTIAGNGVHQSVAIAQGSTGNPFDLFFGVTQKFVGTWAKDLYLILTVTGSFACALAFHNSASRYLYALGREGLHKAVAPLGRTHDKHKSPHVASIVQSVITLVITLYFFLFQAPSKAAPDVAYYYQFGLLAIMGTMAILIVQAICSISVVWYFHVGKRHPETRTWWRTLVAPLAGAAGMGYVVYLLFTHLSFAAGAASDSPVYTITPYLVIGIGVVGAIIALVLRATDRGRYELIGSTVLAESHER
ncbi:APC family permease [Streptacidiphilus sp. EB103A]|uniref:APC family permease n=1 Tax=Streptacidiphilus sp. EB103A TaxID=3156275 RepID=UPI00351529D3